MPASAAGLVRSAGARPAASRWSRHRSCAPCRPHSTATGPCSSRRRMPRPSSPGRGPPAAARPHSLWPLPPSSSLRRRSSSCSASRSARRAASPGWPGRPERRGSVASGSQVRTRPRRGRARPARARRALPRVRRPDRAGQPRRDRAASIRERTRLVRRARHPRAPRGPAPRRDRRPGPPPTRRRGRHRRPRPVSRRRRTSWASTATGPARSGAPQASPAPSPR
jgi:hypothetical protein